MKARRSVRAFSLLALAALAQCAPDSEILGKDGAVMLLIPAGQFTRGGKPEEVADHPRSKGFNFLAEQPLHEVRLAAYYIDKYEVTNEQYWRFLDYLEATGDTTLDHSDQPPAYSHEQRDVGGGKIGAALRGKRQPAVGLSWFDAYAYCSWADKRLPSAAEWEYAARGSNYRTYPWGDEGPDAAGIWRANFAPEVGRAEDGYEVTAPIGSYPDGNSPFGVADMSGNAEEWVYDWMQPRSYLSLPEIVDNPIGPAEGINRTVKGGSYSSRSHYIRIGTRLYGPPFVKTRLQGFRCARDS